MTVPVEVELPPFVLDICWWHYDEARADGRDPEFEAISGISWYSSRRSSSPVTRRHGHRPACGRRRERRGGRMTEFNLLKATIGRPALRPRLTPETIFIVRVDENELTEVRDRPDEPPCGS